ncbi:MAG: phosphatase PAP2 family protein [Myxacorys californica WJT36-NPBG1]|nr:phosphatase PAP2 family protein [Myxacorys californica WJT36-NPBG1]
MRDSNFWKRPTSFLSFLQQFLIARWRSLLLLLMGVCLPLLVFEQLAIVIWQNQISFPWDIPILFAVHSAATPQLDVFAKIFTKLGVFWGVTPVATIVGISLLKLKRWRSLTYLLTTLLGSVIINRTAKEFMHRVRPHLWNSLKSEFDYSFPSGHAMSSMSLIAALVVLTWGTAWCGWVLGIGGLFVITIGWTRLYLGVHFPSDILAGWLVSLAWAIGVSLIIRPHLVKPTSMDEKTSETALTVDEVEEAQAK